MHYSEVLEKWADGKEASDEIIQVIYDIADGVFSKMDDIWANGKFLDYILLKAWCICDDTIDELNWGIETFKRPDFNVYFDDKGGVILILNDIWAKYYDDCIEAAIDLKWFVFGVDVTARSESQYEVLQTVEEYENTPDRKFEFIDQFNYLKELAEVDISEKSLVNYSIFKFCKRLFGE